MSEIQAMIDAGQLPAGTPVAQLAQALLVVADHDNDFQHAGGSLGVRDDLLAVLLPHSWAESTALVVDRFEQIVFNLDAASNESSPSWITLRINKMAQDLGQGPMPPDVMDGWRTEFLKRAEVYRGEAAVIALQAAGYENSLRLMLQGAPPQDARSGFDEQGAQE